MKKIIIGLMIFILCILIFLVSHQSGGTSTDLSLSVINIVDESVTEGDLNIIYIVRKLAHFSIYAILACLAFIFLKLYHKSHKKCFLFSMIFCIIYATSDEIHQLFVPGRSGELIDVLIDTIGAFFGCLITYLIIRGKYEKNQKKIK